MKDFDRDDLRYQAMTDRGSDRPPCDLCIMRGLKKPHIATDYHEIFPRSRVYKHSDYRGKLYWPELCSCLCNECHIGLVHGRLSATGMMSHFISFNVEVVYADYIRVWERFRDLQQSLIISVDFQFPKEDQIQWRLTA